MTKKCIAAWRHLYIDTTGEARACCQFDDTINDSDGKPYNLATHALSEILESDYLKNFRQQSLNGQLPSACDGCKLHEDMGVYSRRQFMNAQLGEVTDDLSVNDPDLQSLELRLDNTCNLRCNICTPTNSSKWLAERLKYEPDNPELLDIARKNKWLRDNEQFWNDLSNQLPNLKKIYVNGGEPFMNKRHLEFIEFVANSGHAEHITIHYNTNATVIPSVQVPWNRFKQIIIHFSIDDIERRFEFQRRGGKWDDVLRTVEHFKKIKASNCIYGICCTVNLQNIMTLSELISWAEQQNCFDVLRLNVLRRPVEFSINEMTKAMQEEVISVLGNISTADAWSDKIINLRRTVENLEVSPAGKFIDYVNSLSDSDKQLFLSGHSNLAKFLDLH